MDESRPMAADTEHSGDEVAPTVPPAKPEQPVAGFFAYDLRVGTVIAAEPNSGARVPAYILTIDFGPLGRRTTSAQLTRRYRPDDLVGRQVVAVVNFPPKRIAGVKSEVLVLGGIPGAGDVVLLAPDHTIPDGTPIA
jgi:tRNA-binding protein